MTKDEKIAIAEAELASLETIVANHSKAMDNPKSST